METKATFHKLKSRWPTADLAGLRKVQFQTEIQYGLQDPKETGGLSAQGPLNPRGRWATQEALDL